jgi:hypothetical protein
MNFDYIGSFSGAAGGLAKVMKGYSDLNDTLTKCADQWFGSADNTDTFDASCNTCKHFSRSPMTPEEKRQRSTFGMPGLCQIKDIPVVGWHRGKYCGIENDLCYQNRRTDLGPNEIIP